ncbi:hypothetical protein A2U01_0082415, partial [Trifolium medium]|nr:hypothetical protein [Trifolium medium]
LGGGRGGAMVKGAVCFSVVDCISGGFDGGRADTELANGGGLVIMFVGFNGGGGGGADPCFSFTNSGDDGSGGFGGGCGVAGEGDRTFT